MITDPNVRTKVVHSRTKSAWNVVGTQLGGKYKIAVVPYLHSDDKSVAEEQKQEALEHAEFIAHCFNNSNTILSK